VSAKASGYMKALVVCPNGERITAREKLVGMVLADSHQDKAKSFTYPSVETIAEESVCDKRTCQRYLAALESKGVIRRLRPPNQGRSTTVFYFFTALDSIPEGWQDATLFDVTLFAQKGGERVAEGWRKGGNSGSALIVRAREREQEQQKQQKQTPPNPLANEGEGGGEENGNDAGKTKNSAASVASNCVPITTDIEPDIHRDAADVAATSARADKALVERGRDRSPEGSATESAINRERAIDGATNQVCNGLGISEPRDRRKIRRAIVLQAEKGDEPPTIALDMMAAYGRQTTARKRGELTASYSVINFITRGVWKDQGRLHWNEQLLRERALAGVGSN